MTFRRPIMQGVAVTVLGLAAVAVAHARPAPSLVAIHEPQSADELGDVFFAPDIANEWMPRGAKALKIRAAQRRPVEGPGLAATEYSYGQAGIRCRIATSSASHVVLPHYYFPQGWKATLDERSVPLHANAAGLMQVDLPANSSGELRIRWTTTPSKWIGLAITVASCLGFAALVGWERLRPRGRPATSRSSPAPPTVAPAARP